MPEQFGFDEFGRYSGAVDFDHRTVRACRVLVDKMRHDLFARTVLSGDEDARLGRRYLFYYFAYTRDSGTRTYHLRTLGTIDFLAQLARLLFERLGFEGVLGRDEDAIQVQRFNQKIVRTEFERLHSRLYIAVTGDHHNGRVDGIVTFFEGFEQLHSIHLRHLDVAEDEVVGFGLRHFESLLAVFRYFYFVPFVRQNLAQRVPNAAFVVYNQ